MCGRFALTAAPEHIAAHFDVPYVPAMAPRYNIAPATAIAVIRTEAETRRCDLMHWGLVPAWSKEPKTGYSTINARAETVASRPAFRSAFRRRRCLIPATGFYEWQTHAGEKKPWYIHRRDDGLFAFAGLWEHWQQGEQALDSCTILVTTANRLMQPLHARMPVILPPEDYALWLDPACPPARLQSLLVPFAADTLVATPVSRQVNNPRHDDPECIRPV